MVIGATRITYKPISDIMSSEAGRIGLAAPFVLAGTLLVRAAAASVSSKVARLAW